MTLDREDIDRLRAEVIGHLGAIEALVRDLSNNPGVHVMLAELGFDKYALSKISTASQELCLPLLNDYCPTCHAAKHNAERE